MKSFEYTVKNTAEILKVLGHPLRIEILRLLSRSKENKLSVTQIQRSLEVSQPEASKHLIVMRNQSILVCERIKGHSIYYINPEYTFIRGIINYLKK